MMFFLQVEVLKLLCHQWIHMEGLPNSIELLVLIDRRYKREIPIEANYCGAKIDTLKEIKLMLYGIKIPKKNVIYIEN